MPVGVAGQQHEPRAGPATRPLKHRFDLFDRARALENQIVWLSANQSGQFGSLQFVASAKVVDSGGEIVADTGVAAGLAVAELDVQLALDTARRSMAYLRDRRPDAYAGSSGDRLTTVAR